MARKILCPLLCLTLFSTGCSTTAPEIKQAIDPKSGDIIQYSSASDGRSFADKYPEISVPITSAVIAGEGLVFLAGVVGLLCLGLTHGGQPNFNSSSTSGGNWDWHDFLPIQIWNNIW